ncbi:MAG TPA: DoxX family protein [Rhodanobacteraceae bacterium]|jgi:putative oxidoreductase|nr:DoxX family protein [Rhodanobacteraceae bacterium]
MKTLTNSADLLGRLFLVLLFVVAGYGKIGGYAGTAAYMAANGVPGLLLPLVIALELGGGILVLLGWHTRIMSLLLAGFTLLALLLFHMPMTAENQIVFLAELGVAGGFLVLAAHGPGAWSLDRWLARRAPAKAVTA